jgi:hypothetical protein
MSLFSSWTKVSYSLLKRGRRRTSAWQDKLKPALLGASEKPKPGRLGATT